MTSTETTLTVARRVADTVLYEGYLLYPYRASAGKNQVRWQFGVLGPPGAEDAGVGEEPTMHTECLLEMPADGTAYESAVDVYLRFLQVQVRTIERAEPDGSFVPVEDLTVGSVSWIRYHEAVEREISFTELSAVDLARTQQLDVNVPGGEDVEILHGEAGEVVGRLIRTRFPLVGLLDLSIRPAPGAERLTILRAELDNRTAWEPGAEGLDKPRDEAARASFVGTHLLLVARGAQFVSLTDPPDWAVEAATACTNHRCWPVLAGAEGNREVVLASPIILPDHAGVAPESPGELFDSTEIDEILTLRIMTLTDEEKVAARGTDPRAAAIIDRSDTMPPEMLDRLHGALRSFDPVGSDPDPMAVAALDALYASTADQVMAPGVNPFGDNSFEGSSFETLDVDPETGRVRTVGSTGSSTPPDDFDIPTHGDKPWWDPGVDASVSPDHDTVLVSGVTLAKGSRVRLAPKRRADAHDLFLAGRTAVVAGVFFDVDDDTHVAVTLEDDPASEFHEWYGRYYYFGPEEVEPLPDRTESKRTESERSS